MAAAWSARWLLVEYSDGTRCVVNVRAVVDGGMKLQVGDEVTVNVRGSRRLGKLINYSDDRKDLDCQMVGEREAQTHVQGLNLYEDLEVGDFSASGSSWGPEEQQQSSDSEAESMTTKKIKLDSIKKQYSNKGNRMRMPTLRPEPVIRPSTSQASPKQSQVACKASKQKRGRTSMPVQQCQCQSTPASTRRQANATPKTTHIPTISVSREELIKVRNDLKEFKAIISHVKSTVARLRSMLTADHLYETVYASNTQEPISNIVSPEADGPIEDKVKEEEAEPDSMLIETIKPVRYGLIKHNPNRRNGQKQRSPADVTQATTSNSSPGSDHIEDTVPIGTGKTLVPKSVYDTINWDSYTMATRKLLMAVFPRRILATHSLTGKASPAFSNRPAKLCLDPKKVSDVAIEVTQKCNIKESLVRSVITTKCGDEYKMFRMQREKERQRKPQHISSFRLLHNQENLPPDNGHGISDGFQSTSYTQTN